MKRFLGISYTHLACLVIGIATYLPAQATVVTFSGQLDVVQIDLGGAVYSGVPIGTNFFGSINDVTANGFISDGSTLTTFGCCIAAGGLGVGNDEALDASEAAFLNSLTGSSFVAGDLIDGINIEGDTLTSGGGRIEIGLSYVFDSLAFSDDSLGNYPPELSDVLVALFFIAEFDSQEALIYSAVGELDDFAFDVSEPYTLGLLGAGLLGLAFVRRRRAT